ncbi:MAG: hypothetical protein EAZ24_13730 [Burkholderiales bacterium]|nr:MAG: hypothetical protein EAZ24_13730 [Burkholderiales bacterium]
MRSNTRVCCAGWRRFSLQGTSLAHPRSRSQVIASLADVRPQWTRHIKAPEVHPQLRAGFCE